MFFDHCLPFLSFHLYHISISPVSSTHLLALLLTCFLFFLTLSIFLFSVFHLLQPCGAVLQGTLCCPQPLSAVLRVLLLWLHLFLSSFTTTLFCPPLPTVWQVHFLCTSCLPAWKLYCSVRNSNSVSSCFPELLFMYCPMFPSDVFCPTSSPDHEVVNQ